MDLKSETNQATSEDYLRDEGIQPEPKAVKKYVVVQIMVEETCRINVDSIMNLLDEFLECDIEHLGFCNCGIMSMSGMAGTENECWKYLGLTDEELHDTSG